MRNNSTCSNTKSKQTSAPEPTSSANSSTLNFTPTTTTLAPNITQPIGTDLQELMMQHQNHPVTSDPTDYHHHTHTHNIQHQILSSSHNQRVAQHQNNSVNHHMLPRPNHPTATSTAAAVAAAMMLDPRFHHNSGVPYPTSTPASMAMAAAVQSTQQIQAASGQHSEYAPTIQNCMALF
ncbi:uncharacterized protein LOC108742916 [Agrilus planipennis]|uniref:Uncharacterized protein LOC108742916 n=1 Tax=Agrilus planipennis TaxID=224129 RepID=A0A1W4XLX8_AGRPL|nr:uncharacterized protein LOC108742916 [Agrilus planipennis]